MFNILVLTWNIFKCGFVGYHYCFQCKYDTLPIGYIDILFIEFENLFSWFSCVVTYSISRDLFSKLNPEEPILLCLVPALSSKSMIPR